MTSPNDNVMISSTTLDLPDHRAKVLDAIARRGMKAKYMETLPADDAEAMKISFKLVDESNIYLGIFGMRYGTVPRGYEISLTEMEYERARAQKKKRLLFIMDEKEHAITPRDVEIGPGAEKLRQLKDRLRDEQGGVMTFISPDDLAKQVVSTLADYNEGKLIGHQYSHDIPPTPDPYVSHTNYDFQKLSCIGRNKELNILTGWGKKTTEDFKRASILSFVGPGGMGKSILAWKWFTGTAPYEMPRLKGRIWWSFDNKDTFDDFVMCALAYVSRQPLETVRDIPVEERRTRLLEILKSQPFLLVMDSFERNLKGYVQDVASIPPDSDNQLKLAMKLAEELSKPRSAAHSFTGQAALRRINDERVADFLYELRRTSKTRILITTRLYPRDLQKDDLKSELPGSKAIFLEGLANDDAVNLWRQWAQGSSKMLLRLFSTFGNYPKLIYLLAQTIAKCRGNPDTIEQWRQAHPDFDFAARG